MPHSLESDFRLFSNDVYHAAKDQRLPTAPLLHCVEDVHAALNGLSAVTLLMASNQVNRGNDLELSDVMLEQLQGLTRVMLSLLVDKLEVTADALHQAAGGQFRPD